MRSPLAWLVVGVWSLGIMLALGVSFATILTVTKVAAPIATTVPPTAQVLPTHTPSPITSITFVPTPSAPPSTTPRPTLKPSPLPTLSIRVTLTATPSNPLVIGGSVLGRPLEVYKFGSGAKARMIIAGIHGGNEWNTVALADELIAYLQTHPEKISHTHTLFVLRNLNPDGYARSLGIRGRTNENNVDLNRNFPSLWVANWKRDGCWVYLPTNAGTRAGSEPETQAVMQFILTQKVEALINYHSAALGIFAGGQPPNGKSLRLAEAVSAVSDYPYPPIDTGCQFTGQLIDWASAQGVAALDIELTNHSDTDFERNLRILEVILQWSP